MTNDELKQYFDEFKGDIKQEIRDLSFRLEKRDEQQLLKCKEQCVRIESLEKDRWSMKAVASFAGGCLGAAASMASVYLVWWK